MVEECALEGRRGIALPDLFGLVAARSDAEFDDNSERIPPNPQSSNYSHGNEAQERGVMQCKQRALACTAMSTARS
jgi:hypothetical protein